MGFPERITKIRNERKIGFPELAKMTGIHVTQLRRYEKGESQPTLDALRRLAIAFNVPGDMLLFDDNERKPPEDFVLQFEALTQLSPENKKTIRDVIDGLIIRNQAHKLIN
jgi:transcriptional regulator with XRE-family HTH domain